MIDFTDNVLTMSAEYVSEWLRDLGCYCGHDELCDYCRECYVLVGVTTCQSCGGAVWGFGQHTCNKHASAYH